MWGRNFESPLLVVVVSNVLCIFKTKVLWVFECSAVTLLGQLVIVEGIVVLIRIVVVILNFWCVLVLIVLVLIITVQFVLVHELHADFLHLWLLLGEDCLYPCTLRHDEHLVIIGKFLLVQATWLLQTILRKGSGADVEVTLDDVLDALR